MNQLVDVRLEILHDIVKQQASIVEAICFDVIDGVVKQSTCDADKPKVSSGTEKRPMKWGDMTDQELKELAGKLRTSAVDDLIVVVGLIKDQVSELKKKMAS
jgi:uncharacterized protein YjbJ (UPF0337 family)